MDRESCKSLPTPGVRASGGCLVEVDDSTLNGGEPASFRSGVARCNRLALDRPDIALAAKETCKRMFGPVLSDMTPFKRTSRYL